MGFFERFRRFMYGRYGVDTLGQWITYGVLAMIILNLFLRSRIINGLELLLMILCVYRIFSRNISKRSKENTWFCQKKDKLFGWAHREKNLMRQRKDFHIYTCPGCRQKIRIPRGKGKISITCPKCHTQFIKRS